MSGVTFRTTIEAAGKNATGLPVPDAVVAALGSSKKPAVHVIIGDYRYRSTVARMGGRYLLPFAAEHRKATGLAAGDEIDVELQLDTEPRQVEVPSDFAAALDGDAAAKERFAAMSYSHQRQWVLSVEDAKTPATRERRIAKALDALRTG